MVYKLEHVRSDREADAVSDRVIPLPRGRRAVAADRVEPKPARIAELLAQIGALGERIDIAAQRSVDALRQARNEPGIESWDAASAEILLELAVRIETSRCRLDAALARDQARLGGDDGSSTAAAGDSQAAMDPDGPGMI